ncbi:MAG TPA: hypothetical protein VF391_02860 [Dermatophilaceae bacterium]|jgi:hypothetical protein
MPTAEAHDDDLDGSLDDVLTDDALESEIELVSVLVVAATSSDRPLRMDEVDRLLGLDPQDGGPVPLTE